VELVGPGENPVGGFVFILRSFTQKGGSMTAVSLIASIAALASCATTDQNLRRDVIYKCGEEDCSPLIAAKRIFKLGKAYIGAAVIRAFSVSPKTITQSSSSSSVPVSASSKSFIGFTKAWSFSFSKASL
jgi:hypothetical protein